MDWLSDPTVWIGLVTLVALEIVLGVDNLIFIAILSDRLPAAQRDRARVIGLSLALVMRLALLAGISWVMSLTAPLVSFWRFEVSWRDLILIAGGLFLLVKATTEIHDRIEPRQAGQGGARATAFWPIVAQIVVLDAVFSLDSVITAVGMVDHLAVMMTAVVIAVLAMLVASKPLTRFILARPSLIILCLGFLLMVGLVLVVDGLGVHVPKGYVYAAIGFSLLIEILNQLAARGRRRALSMLPPRQRVADAVLKLLGGVPVTVPEVGGDMFKPAQRSMVGEVLRLADLRVDAIMTPREDVAWVDAAAAPERIVEDVRGLPHREFPVAHGTLERIAGVVRKEDLLDGDPLEKALQPGTQIREDCTVLDALALFKKHPIELALVVDAQGGFRGVLTRTDLLESIAGELPDLP
ncbi:MAG TPA: CBS domain-containing protein [Burkholderiales bacterium]